MYKEKSAPSAATRNEHDEFFAMWTQCGAHTGDCQCVRAFVGEGDESGVRMNKSAAQHLREICDLERHVQRD